VAALGIGGELDLVDRQEADAAVDRIDSTVQTK
jgi:hypothetical protein